MMPLYSAFQPPSVLYMVAMSSNMPGSFLPALFPNSLKDADCIESLVRTISSGYVNVTEVIPARPPHNSRCTEFNFSPGVCSKYCEQVSRVDVHMLRFSILVCKGCMLQIAQRSTARFVCNSFRYLP